MEHHKNDKKPVEDLGPNVITIKPPPRFGMFGSMFIRIGIGLLILGAGVLAVYYSIEIHGDDKEEVKSDKTFFSLTKTQYCIKDGIYTREYNNGYLSNGSHNHTTKKYNTIWVQDHEHQRLYYTIGDENDVDYQAYYIFKDYSLFLKGKTCTKQSIGYDAYISSFGLDDMAFIREEQILLTSESKEKSEEGENEGKEYQHVNFYQGELFFDETSKFKINKMNQDLPYLGFGYMDTYNSKTFSWQFYYQDIKGNKIYFEEYWYPSMKTGLTDINYFNNISQYCPNL